MRRPVRRGGGPEPIGSVLKRMPMRAPVDLAVGWREAVGEPASDYSRPLRLEGGVLTVEVSSAALLQELAGFRARAIEDACRRVFGDRIRRVRYRAGR